MANFAYEGSQREVLLEGPSASRELLAIGASYRTAPLEFRELLTKTFSASGLDKVQSFSEVKESALLSTCNRLELYFVTDSPDLTIRKLTEMLEHESSRRLPERAIFGLSGPAAVSHLFRVAAGLDSMVLGEPQILSQVRSAGAASRKAGSARGILSPLFDRASRVGARVRASYGIGSGEASLSDVAVDIVFESIHQRPKVLLIGTGKMVQLAARRLQGRAGAFYVASNRRRAPKGLSGSKLISYGGIQRIAAECDVVIAATTTMEPLLNKEDLAGRKKRIVVDLGMPRNISPAVRNLPNVRLIDLDDLAKAQRGRVDTELTRGAENMVAAEASEFYAWLIQTRLSSTLSELFGWANGVREAELTRAMRKFGQPSARDKRIVEAMGKRIVSKLMARPAGFARRKYGMVSEEEKLDLLRSVFRPDNHNEDKNPTGN